MFNKRGDTGWTVSKILTIILLVIVLALVIYGVTTGGINPLVERIGRMMDSILVMLNVRNSYDNSCYFEKVVNLQGGKNFLDLVGVEGIQREDVVIALCDEGICNLSGGGLDDYRMNKGVFQTNVNGKWVSYEGVVFSDNLKEQRFYFDLYNKASDTFDEAGVKEFYDKRYTKQFILYGEYGISIGDSSIRATWQNGVWTIVTSDGVETFEDDEKAIEFFEKDVRGFLDDKEVYYKESFIAELPDETDEEKENLEGEQIGNLIGNSGFLSSYDELDSDKEVIALKEKFLDVKKKLLSETKPSSEEIDNLKKSLEGKTVEIDGETFSLGLDESEAYPMIILNSGKEEYGFRFNTNSKILDENTPFATDTSSVKLRHYPLVIVKKENSQWNEVGFERNYKLPEEIFNNAYEGTVVYGFLKSKCR